eukprot:5941185-Amphidinium_carterae.1
MGVQVTQYQPGPARSRDDRAPYELTQRPAAMLGPDPGRKAARASFATQLSLFRAQHLVVVVVVVVVRRRRRRGSGSGSGSGS